METRRIYSIETQALKGLALSCATRSENNALAGSHRLRSAHTGTTGYLSFHPMAHCVVHALKGLACRAPVLLAHAEVAKNVFFSMDPRLRHPTVSKYTRHLSSRSCGTGFQCSFSIGVFERRPALSGAFEDGGPMLSAAYTQPCALVHEQVSGK